MRLWYEGTAAGQVQIFLLGDNERFTTAFEATGRFILTASDGETLEIVIGVWRGHDGTLSMDPRPTRQKLSPSVPTSLASLTATPP